MKVIDLIYEKKKMEHMLSQGSYFVMEQPDKEKEARQAGKARQRYEGDQRLLKKLDEINNALCASDAAAYVEVEGCRLSVATARLYLREINGGMLDIDDVFDGEGMGFNHYSGNLRDLFLQRCAGGGESKFLPEPRRIDPAGLCDRQEEFEAKKLDWEIGLKKAIAMSDATTDVDFII